jgi:hypothetical protein
LGERRNALRIFVGKLEGNRPLGKQGIHEGKTLKCILRKYGGFLGLHSSRFG